MNPTTENYFATLSNINVSQHIERKGDFAYLSWPFAVAQLRLADPQATWETKRFDGLPYCKTETGFFVEVAVTVHSITLSQIHPVLDGKNRPIFEPNAFDINTSIQRCLVKAIALHGLGLYIYAGEDLPQAETAKHEEVVAKPKASVSTLPTANTASTAQLRYIAKLIDETGTEVTKVLQYFNLKALSDLTTHTASRVIKSLEKNRRAA